MFDNNIPRGTIVTIMGTPRSNEAGALDPMMNAIKSIAETGMIDFEVGHLNNVGVLTEKNIAGLGADSDDDIEELKEPPFNTAAFRAGASLIGAASEINDNLKDVSEKTRRAALTPEERQAEDAAVSKAVLKRYEDSYHRVIAERDASLDHAMDTVDTWANKPGLTVEEACHGVARDMFIKYGEQFIPTPAGDWVPHDRGQAYADLFEIRQEDRIKARQIRAAKELFGS